MIGKIENAGDIVYLCRLGAGLSPFLKPIDYGLVWHGQSRRVGAAERPAAQWPIAKCGGEGDAGTGHGAMVQSRREDG